MTAEELHQIEMEESKIVKMHEKLFKQHTHLAFKFISLPLEARVKLINETNSQQYLLRNYTEFQWHKRMCVTAEQLCIRNQDHSFKITTKSSWHPTPKWDWKLDFQVAQNPNLNSVSDELRIFLSAVDIDHTGRSVEYMLMVCGERKVLKTMTGRKSFTKPKYSVELEKILEVNELFTEDSVLLHDGNLQLQLLLRPII